MTTRLVLLLLLLLQSVVVVVAASAALSPVCSYYTPSTTQGAGGEATYYVPTRPPRSLPPLSTRTAYELVDWWRHDTTAPSGAQRTRLHVLLRLRLRRAPPADALALRRPRALSLLALCTLSVSCNDNDDNDDNSRLGDIAVLFAPPAATALRDAHAMLAVLYTCTTTHRADTQLLLRRYVAETVRVHGDAARLLRLQQQQLPPQHVLRARVGHATAMRTARFADTAWSSPSSSSLPPTWQPRHALLWLRTRSRRLRAVRLTLTRDTARVTAHSLHLPWATTPDSARDAWRWRASCYDADAGVGVVVVVAAAAPRRPTDNDTNAYDRNDNDNDDHDEGGVACGTTMLQLFAHAPDDATRVRVPTRLLLQVTPPTTATTATVTTHDDGNDDATSLSCARGCVHYRRCRVIRASSNNRHSSSSDDNGTMSNAHATLVARVRVVADVWQRDTLATTTTTHAARWRRCGTRVYESTIWRNATTATTTTPSSDTLTRRDSATTQRVPDMTATRLRRVRVAATTPPLLLALPAPPPTTTATSWWLSYARRARAMVAAVAADAAARAMHNARRRRPAHESCTHTSRAARACLVVVAASSPHAAASRVVAALRVREDGDGMTTTPWWHATRWHGSSRCRRRWAHVWLSPRSAPPPPASALLARVEDAVSTWTCRHVALTAWQLCAMYLLLLLLLTTASALLTRV